MKFCALEPDHPYLKMMTDDDVRSVEHFYHQDDAMWPVYGITHIRMKQGFQLSVSVKTAEDACWEPCNYFNLIPYELAPIIQELLA